MDWQLLARYPYGSLAVAMLIVAAPLLAAQFNGAGGRLRSAARSYARAAIALALLAALLLAARYLAVARPGIGGVDFFYFVTTARDYLHGVAWPSFSRFSYFPGAYRSWQAAMALFGEGLATLQWFFVGLLVANAVLVSAVVSRVLGSLVAGVIAGLWYLALASRLEGLAGTTEPIATLYALLGLAAWGGMPLRGRAGWRRALLLGAGLGLAAWTKQQGGLVALGAATLVVTWAMVPRGERHSLWQMAAVPAAAALAFLCAMLLEQAGLQPLRSGLATLGGYEAKGSLIENLRAVRWRIGYAGEAAMLGALVWASTIAIPRLRRMHLEPWTAIAGFALIAMLASLVQFSKRQYLHYALITAPFVAIAGVIAIERIARAASALKPGAAALVAVAMAYALSAPLIVPHRVAPYLYLWPPKWNPPTQPQAAWHLAPDVASDVDALVPLLKRGEDMLVLPQRRVVLHFLTGTRSISAGYGWGPRDAVEFLASPTLTAVLVLDRQTLDETDVETWEGTNCDRTVAALPANGFVKVRELKTMTLWRRTP